MKTNENQNQKKMKAKLPANPECDDTLKIPSLTAHDTIDVEMSLYEMRELRKEILYHLQYSSEPKNGLLSAFLQVLEGAEKIE